MKIKLFFLSFAFAGIANLCAMNKKVVMDCEESIHALLELASLYENILDLKEADKADAQRSLLDDIEVLEIYINPMVCGELDWLRISVKDLSPYCSVDSIAKRFAALLIDA